MKLIYVKLYTIISGYKNVKKAIYVLFAGFALTALISYNSYRNVEKQEKEEFITACKEIELKIATRLRAHALILRAGSAHFGVSDTVTRDEWKKFIELSKIEDNLPGILGVGCSLIIPPNKLDKHIRQIQNEGFPDYKVYPEGKRDIYTSIIYLEPFSGRNLRAFGYDMFSEPVRRKAMELSRDNDVAMLSGKVGLVQETNDDIQSGTLMYVPFYKPGMPANTVEERRSAIVGWIYSPYRMDDLMEGILGPGDKTEENKIHLQVYDDSLSTNLLLHDSEPSATVKISSSSNRTLLIPVEFNGKKWILYFAQPKKTIFTGIVFIILISGFIISLLLFLLSVSVFNIQYRSQQIKKQNSELQKLNSEKDKFFSIIAHDLKSPFNTIIGFSEILKEQIAEKNFEGIEKFSEIILKSANRALNLLLNLMQWSQSQTGRMEFSPEPFDLVELIKDVTILLSNTAQKKSIGLIQDLPKQLSVFADKNMISTILRNLISNAIKFTHPNGKISISVQSDVNNITVKVIDNGVGIPKEAIDKLFHIENKYTSPGTKDEKGTGLGLILCKEFVEKHNGKIWVESRENEGSAFWFTIPVINDSAPV